MQLQLTDFIRSGAVGEIMLGITRSDALQKLGQPENWLGKPPCFGTVVTDFARSQKWFYYNNAVGIEFDQMNVAAKITTTLDEIDGKIPFESWPIVRGSKMHEFRNYLLQSGIPFYEESELEHTHFILAYRDCVAQCRYFEKGTQISPDDRPLTMITTVASDDLLPDFVRGQPQKDWSSLRSFFHDFSSDCWRHGATSAENVISDYLRRSDPVIIRELSTAISAFLRRIGADSDTERRLHSEFGFRYIPSSSGLTAKQWLENILSRLDH